MNKFTVLIGPANDKQVVQVINAIAGIAPLVEVKQIKENGKLPSTGITRHHITEDDKRSMIADAEAGFSIEKIAAKIPCAVITVRRHVPKFQEGYKL